MSYSIRGNVIRMTKGDTLDAKIRIRQPKTDQLYIPKDTDTIFFGLKKRIDDEFCLVYKQIPNDTLILHLDPEDTESLDVGNYWYDVQLSTQSGEIHTFIPKTAFKLLGEACYND